MTADEHVSDERLAEIRGLINWNHSGWQTLPSGPNVTKYDLAAAVEDLLRTRAVSDQTRTPDAATRYVWGRRFGRRWIVQSARIERGAKIGEVVVRAWTKRDARRVARAKVVPETWMVLGVERFRG